MICVCDTALFARRAGVSRPKCWPKVHAIPNARILVGTKVTSTHCVVIYNLAVFIAFLRTKRHVFSSNLPHARRRERARATNISRHRPRRGSVASAHRLHHHRLHQAIHRTGPNLSCIIASPYASCRGGAGAIEHLTRSRSGFIRSRPSQSARRRRLVRVPIALKLPIQAQPNVHTPIACFFSFVHALFAAYRLRLAVQVTIDAFASGESNVIVMIRAQNSLDILDVLYDAAQQRASHVITRRINGVNARARADEREMPSIDAHSVTSVEDGEKLRGVPDVKPPVSERRGRRWRLIHHQEVRARAFAGARSQARKNVAKNEEDYCYS